MGAYIQERREKFFDYLNEIFNLSGSVTVLCNKVIPYEKTELFGGKTENVSVDIITAVANDGDAIISTSGLCIIAGCELCLKLPADIARVKCKLIVDIVYNYCEQIAKCFANKNDGTTLTIDFSDIVGNTAFAEITNGRVITTFCDGVCEWLYSMCWLL